ncbi:4-diphosphocytidyl-2C-methyl-D-erythritol kinase [Pseudorhizobium endolithicum]|uniref:4-diphosphocytidyl-2C-methyl-D-erythritol kinase n=1 Tax=Pseudorhizobium endolithicum TaxID=1191678 RepID=A0ABM8PRS2_9HYPH|nr:molybdopterin-binding/glycosyltransferase family 2 protein [Pseudorhizobium endolithicum]CAD6414667.1 4-diphosphocytidyl-2C-methyl-D-erythritol kinase [Rhizobium sp. Q54]CAD7044985.1 4-diphosphocytidyl-2C-methyl-D-erythritol kinase [Pseudorhizobium endolithicum]
MRFSRLPPSDAEGCILAHSIRLSIGKLPKGRILTGQDIEALAATGVTEITAVRLDPGDLLEDEAASAISAAFLPGAFRLSAAATGRVNVHSTVNGLFTVDRDLVDALNGIDPAITLATLADYVAVRAGDMIATVKIIPLAVSGAKVAEAVKLLGQVPAFSVEPFTAHRVTLVATELPSLKTSVMEKTARLLERRLAASGSHLDREIRVPHDEARLATELKDLVEGDAPGLIVIFGASAVADPEDVIPAAIRAAGGHVERVGMPVDPGNLLVLGRIGSIPVIGAPGCARSPKENGFDWVLNRILAGEQPSGRDISRMGVGGLLGEIPERPRPRETASAQAGTISIGALLLAAGQSRRMGGSGSHKLLSTFEGEPLVRRSAKRLLAAGLAPVVAVTGHRRGDIEAAFDELALTVVFNPDYESGMASSLQAGLSLPALNRCDGVVVMLADMPAVTADHLRRMMAAFRKAGGQAVVRAVHEGKRGNPVILPKSTFPDVQSLRGDVGARAVIENCGLPTVDVEIGAAAHVDVDTVEAVIAAGGHLEAKGDG